jgi:hypothetical protein
LWKEFLKELPDLCGGFFCSLIFAAVEEVNGTW